MAKKVKQTLADRLAAKAERTQEAIFKGVQDRFVEGKDGKLEPLGPRPSIFDV